MINLIDHDGFRDLVGLATNRPLLYARSVPPGIASLVKQVESPPEFGMDAGLGGIPAGEIRNGEMSYRLFRDGVLAKAYPRLKYGDPDLWQAIRDFFGASLVFESISNRLHPRLKLAADWVFSDLTDAAWARGGLGRTTFYERLIEIYLAGGWPVGFADSWGEGRILTVFPGNRLTRV